MQMQYIIKMKREETRREFAKRQGSIAMWFSRYSRKTWKEFGQQFYLACTHFWCTQGLADPVSNWTIKSSPAFIGLLQSLHTESNLAVSNLLLLLAGILVHVILLFRGNVWDKCLDENGAAFPMLGGVCGGVGKFLECALGLSRPLAEMWKSTAVMLFPWGPEDSNRYSEVSSTTFVLGW